jgi:carbamoyltransferase
MRVLGLSFSGHGTSMCLVEDGRIVRALNLERITRKKFSLTALPAYVDFLRQVTVTMYRGQPETYFDFYDVFPKMLNYVTNASDLREAGIDLVVKTRDNISPLPDFGEGPMQQEYAKFLEYFRGVRVAFEVEHHLAHAYQAYLCSPFEETAILTIDGSGESLPRLGGDSVSTSFAVGRREQVSIVKEICFPHTVGGLYSSVTRHLGFKDNQEGNIMALAAFGTDRFYGVVRRDFALGRDGNYRLEFGRGGKSLKILDRMEEYVAPRRADEEISERHKDVARAVQRITEEIVVNAARRFQKRSGLRRLAIAGGVGLNCVANAQILEHSNFKELYVMPNAGDRGLAAGCALYGYHVVLGGRQRNPPGHDYLGRSYDDHEIKAAIEGTRGLGCRKCRDVAAEVAQLLASGSIVGWLQGGAEFGPRALGHRSILADPRTLESKRRLDQEVKRREWFRPYAPSVLRESAGEYFADAISSPYMLLAFRVQPAVAKRIVGVTHVDGSARVQTVERGHEPLFHRLISEFAKRAGVAMVLNTSFNANGAPMVETPQDALEALKEMNLDALAIGDHLVWREAALVDNANRQLASAKNQGTPHTSHDLLPRSS